MIDYATTKGAIQNFTAGLAQLLAPKGIRANGRGGLFLEWLLALRMVRW
jgi:hypothetical protein